MKIVHIAVRSKTKVILPKSFVGKLPKMIGLFTTSQYIVQLPAVKKQLESAGKKVILFQTRHTPSPGQILGCNVQRFDGVDAFVFVGDGMFHPRALVVRNSIPVHIYNPETKGSTIIDDKDALREKRRMRGALAAFLSAKEVGVLITVKPGQYGIEAEHHRTLNGLDRSLALARKYPAKGFHFLVGNDIRLESLADWNFIDVFVNTACPRIAVDDYASSPRTILNIEDIEQGDAP